MPGKNKGSVHGNSELKVALYMRAGSRAHKNKRSPFVTVVFSGSGNGFIGDFPDGELVEKIALNEKRALQRGAEKWGTIPVKKPLLD